MRAPLGALTEAQNLTRVLNPGSNPDSHIYSQYSVLMTMSASGAAEKRRGRGFSKYEMSTSYGYRAGRRDALRVQVRGGEANTQSSAISQMNLDQRDVGDQGHDVISRCSLR